MGLLQKPIRKIFMRARKKVVLWQLVREEYCLNYKLMTIWVIRLQEGDMVFGTKILGLFSTFL